MFALRLSLLLLAVAVYSAPLNSKKVVLAINCGTSSVSLPANDGFRYVPDSKYVEGDSHEADYTVNEAINDVDIRFTFERDIYMYERHTYSQMTYRLPVKQGYNTIILKFAEMYFEGAGKRVFDVMLGKKIIFKDLDIFAEVGKFAAADKYIEVEIRDGKCYYKGEPVAGALQNEKLVIQFVKGKADNPIVQGIIVYNAPVQDSNEAEYKELKSKWIQHKEMQKARKEEQEIKDLIAIQKKKEKIIIRNDQMDMQDEEEEESKGETAPQSKGFVRGLLMSPLGVLVEAVAIGWGIIFVLQNVFLMRSGTKGV